MHSKSIFLFKDATTVTTVTLQDGFASLDSYVSQTLDWTGLDITSVTMCMRFQMFQMRGLLDGSLWSGSVREHVENNFFVASKINEVKKTVFLPYKFLMLALMQLRPRISLICALNPDFQKLPSYFFSFSGQKETKPPRSGNREGPEILLGFLCHLTGL